jgi:hypothetical protein
MRTGSSITCNAQIWITGERQIEERTSALSGRKMKRASCLLVLAIRPVAGIDASLYKIKVSTKTCFYEKFDGVESIAKKAVKKLSLQFSDVDCRKG